MLNSEENWTAFDEKELAEQSEGNVKSNRRKFLHTIPRKFQSLIGRPIRVDSEAPQDLIQLLGNILEITDYETNMVSFWFLDMLALQVLRYGKNLDDHYLSVLISWLSGEMTLIRDRKYSREDFFEELNDIFNAATVQISEENRLLYWDEIVKGEGEEETKEIRSKEFASKNTESTSSFHSEGVNEFFSNVDPLFVLDNLIESSYDMYANELRYALIYAVFVESVEIQSYQLPFLFRTPRPVKLVQPKILLPFNIRLQEKMKRAAVLEKSKNHEKKGKGNKKMTARSPDTPPPSLNDEEMLLRKREFILPLIEANEALEIFNAYAEDITD